ncbi:MAG: hypothetical protein M3Y08_05795 [Fibrobacterota bacterium]|nr:hypothetical protein [Fibrobacterota bacterium]
MYIRKKTRSTASLLAICAAAIVSGCKGETILEAERSAPVGNEFIRLYPDGRAEYGYVVVKENLKAQGTYRYANDTLWFLAEAFKPHFPGGYLPIADGKLVMGSGLHFRIKKNKLK